MRATSHSTAPRSCPEGLYCETSPTKVSKSLIGLFARNDFSQNVYQVIDLLVGDHQRRQESDDTHPRVDSNDSLILECFEIGSHLLLHLNADHQPQPAHFADVGRIDPLQLLHQILAIGIG